MTPERLKIAASNELKDGASSVFAYRDGSGFLSEGFVFRRDGKLYAYQNQCRHQPLTLDYGDNDFFTDDDELLLCRNHGALFEPESGRCVAGPCAGAYLHKLKVVEEEGNIYLIPPEDMPDLE